MKRLILLMFAMVFFVAINAWSYGNPSDCTNFSVSCVKSQFNVSDNGLWAPQKGASVF